MNKADNLDKMSQVRVLAVGDIMLDRYNYGRVDRISPEAPVPIFRPIREKAMLGGVGNVAANLVALGCSVDIVSRIGQDKDGRAIAAMASKAGMTPHFLHQANIPSTVKTRLIAENSHLLRIDAENVCPLNDKLSELAAHMCSNILDKVDVVLISDYAKGLLTERLCKAIISECKMRGKKAIVDPKGRDYSRYRGAFLVKPNLKELSLETGKFFSPASPTFLADVEKAATALGKEIEVGGLLVTLSEYGMLYVPVHSPGKPFHLPTKAKEVFDVSGAGDTALAALGASIGAGFDILHAMQIANAAASVVVSKLGTATASLNEIRSAISESAVDVAKRKIVSASTISEIAKTLKHAGKVIGFTNGCFDCCHLGHLHSLQEAKSLCDVLVVGVNSDKWIKRHKGLGRPIQDQKTRSQLLASLECVDYVVVFGHETALPIVKRIRPNVIAKEGYALKDWPEGRFVIDIGGRAVKIKRLAGRSTTKTANRIKRLT